MHGEDDGDAGRHRDGRGGGHPHDVGAAGQAVQPGAAGERGGPEDRLRGQGRPHESHAGGRAGQRRPPGDHRDELDVGRRGASASRTLRTKRATPRPVVSDRPSTATRMRPRTLPAPGPAGPDPWARGLQAPGPAGPPLAPR